MFCEKCGNEISEGSAFCSKCGNAVGNAGAIETSAEENNQISEPSNNKIKVDSTKIKKYAPFIGIGVAVLVVVIVAISFISKQVKISKQVAVYKAFLIEKNYVDAETYFNANSIEKGFSDKAAKVAFDYYHEVISGEDSAQAADLFNGVLSDMYRLNAKEEASVDIKMHEENFVSKSEESQDALGAIEKYKSFDDDDLKSEAVEAENSIKELNASRKNYEDGIASYEKNNYAQALTDLSRVKENDSNYDDAQNKINEMIPKYKAEVFKAVEESKTNYSYPNALAKLDSLAKFCKDNDVSEKKKEIEKLKKEYDEEQARIAEEKRKEAMDIAEKNQLVSATSCKIKDYGYWIVNMGVGCIVKNDSGKTVKDVKLDFMFYDNSGNQANYYNTKNFNSMTGTFEDISLRTGKTYGSNKYWDDIPKGAKKARCCVEKVTYEDGTTWNNPYYSYWSSEYSDNYDGKSNK